MRLSDLILVMMLASVVVGLIVYGLSVLLGIDA